MIPLALSELAAVLDCDMPGQDVQITNVITDSRKVEPGALFAALPTLVPETGRYFLLVYRTDGAETSRWKARVRVRQGRDSKRLKGEGATIRFAAADGSSVV